MISIIVPVYNSEKTLQRCLDSLLMQTYRDLEIIIINDGSNDNSDYICNNYADKDSRIRYQNRPNGGVSAARNFGLDMARGDYIAFVDSDDYLEHDMYQKMSVEAAAKDADMVFVKYKVFGGDDSYNKQEDNLTDAVINKNLRWFILSERNVMGVVWRTFFKKRAIGNLRFNENIKEAEDLCFMLECLAKANNVSVIDEYLYNYYYIGDNSKKYIGKKFVGSKITLGLELNRILNSTNNADLANYVMFDAYVKCWNNWLYAYKNDKELKQSIIANEKIRNLGDDKYYASYVKLCNSKERFIANLLKNKKYNAARLILQFNQKLRRLF